MIRRPPRSTLFPYTRRFRPQIIVSVFAGTPADGHGQHQVAGLLARQAFDLLRDSTWGPVKLYRSTRFDSAATNLTLPAGTLDPIVGQSYYQLAMASRSRHRSQDMGQLQRPGPSNVRVSLLSVRASVRPGVPDAFFAGVDTAWHGSGMDRYASLIDSARAALNPFHPGAVLPYLSRALRLLGTADAEQRALLERAVAIAAGVSIDGTTDDGIVTQGQRLQVEVNVWNAGDNAVQVDSLDVRAPAGWTVERLDFRRFTVSSGAVSTPRLVVGVGPEAARTQPYFLRRPLTMGGGLYDWTGVPPDVRGLPFDPPPVEARVRLTIAGEPVTLTREVVYRYRDQEIGEVRRPLFVTRAFDVAIAPDEVLWPVDGGGKDPRHFTVTVTNRARGPASARVTFTAPAGWPPVPAESLAFGKEDETKSITVALSPPLQRLAPGSYELRAAVVGGGADGRPHDAALPVI